MKTIIKIATLIILLTGTSLGIAAEPITGAFGIKLGDVLNSSDALQRTILPSGVVKYEVKAVTPHKSFQKFDVEVTVGTKKIHTVNGAGRYPGMESAMKEFNAVKTELESKYGPAKTNRREGAAYFPSGKKTISLLVNQERASVVFLNLSCRDEELTPLAEKEVPPPPPQEEIEGAFGFKFGQVFDPSKSLGTSKNTAGEILYRVNPPTPNPTFENYYIEVTPDTKKIFHVWAQAKISSDAEAKIRRDSLAQAIIAKYQAQKGMLDSEFARILVQGDTTVIIKTYPNPGGGILLDLRYKNENLAKEGRTEAVGKDAKKMDTKGL